MSDLSKLWTIPFLLGFAAGMISSLIAALTFVGSIAAEVRKSCAELKTIVDWKALKESARTGDSR